jgi:molybdopterin-guanine dinucleotide biosynthesis protein A
MKDGGRWTKDDRQKMNQRQAGHRSSFVLRPSSPSIGAALLAGGASSRMGSNKALLRLGLDGLTLIEAVVARLAQGGFSAPAIITNNPGEYTFLHLPTFPDDAPGNGALGGILTALRHSSHSHVLVVACDMPFLNPALLRYMASVPDEYDVFVPAWSDASGKRRVEPLHAIYSKTALPTIEHRIATGQLKLHKLLDALNSVYMPEEETRLHDPQLLSFRNVNTPEDWARLLSDEQPAAREDRAPGRE